MASGAKLQTIRDELIKREPIFHRLEWGTTRVDLENMTHEDFWEVGASGKKYTREFVIETLLERYKKQEADIWEAKGFECFEIAPDNYLLTYTLIQDYTRITRRSTLWRFCENTWKILYHQGTIVQEEK